MTFREKLKMEHPKDVGDNWTGGCRGCPCSYGYESEDDSLCSNPIYDDMCHTDKCTKCWDREIPENDSDNYDLCDACEDLVRARAVLVEGGFTSTEAFRLIERMLSM